MCMNPMSLAPSACDNKYSCNPFCSTNCSLKTALLKRHPECLRWNRIGLLGFSSCLHSFFCYAPSLVHFTSNPPLFIRTFYDPTTTLMSSHHSRLLCYLCSSPLVMSASLLLGAKAQIICLLLVLEDWHYLPRLEGGLGVNLPSSYHHLPSASAVATSVTSTSTDAH